MNPFFVPLIAWYHTHARDLPWRGRPSPWGVLVSEFMLQQTPATRVIPYWQAWMKEWPLPCDLGDAPIAEVIRAWGTLGYPRRALRLRESAQIISHQYGEVPRQEEILRTLPGIGEYTAAAVACFAYGQRTVVLDTNIRRLLSRVYVGEARPTPHITTSERTLAANLLPHDPTETVVWNQAAMELGALICRVRDPDCDLCPLRDLCTWREARYPGDIYASKRRTQGWEGTDRQARGHIMAILRESDGELVPIAAILASSPRSEQTTRAITALIADGLAVQEGEAIGLP